MIVIRNSNILFIPNVHWFWCGKDTKLSLLKYWKRFKKLWIQIQTFTVFGPMAKVFAHIKAKCILCDACVNHGLKNQRLIVVYKNMANCCKHTVLLEKVVISFPANRGQSSSWNVFSGISLCLWNLLLLFCLIAHDGTGSWHALMWNRSSSETFWTGASPLYCRTVTSQQEASWCWMVLCSHW